MSNYKEESKYSWRALFDDETYTEGESLYLKGKAKKPGEDEHGFYATVRDDRNYKVEILDDGYGIYAMKCSCNEAAEKHYCRHMAAALMFLEDIYEDWEFSISDDLADAEAAKRLEGTKSAKSNSSAAKPVKKAPKDSPLVTLHREGLELLQELSAQDSRDRAEAVSPEDEKARAELEEYRFFDTSQFRKGLKIPTSVRMETEKLITRGDMGKTEFSLGMFRIPRQLTYYRGKGDEKEDDEQEVRLRVRQHSKYGTWYVDQIYNWNTLLYSHCQDWKCFPEKPAGNPIGHELCCHEYAALLATEQYLENNNIGDITTVDARSFLGVFGSALSQKEEEQTGETLKLSPQLRIDERGNWSVQFQVGTKRLYKIKNLPVFLKDMEQHQYEQFGKSTSLHLGKEYLDEHGLKWVTFVEDAIHSLRLFLGNDANPDSDVYFYDYTAGWQKLTDKIPLVAEILDRFVNAMEGEKVDVERSIGASWNRSKEKFTLTVGEGHLRPVLTLDPFYQKENRRFEGVVLKGRLPELLHGSAFAYAIEKDSLKRIPKEESAALDALYRSVNSSGMIRLQIGRTALSDFYRKALPKLREYAEVEEADPSIPEKYLPEEAAFVCYLDVDQDCVLCRPFVYYGSLRHSPFDVYGWKSRKKTPEHYRDTLGETKLMELLGSYLPERDDSAELFLTEKGELPLYAFLDHGLTELLRISEVKATDRFMRLKLRKKVPFSAGVSVESGIMDLTLTSEELSPEELAHVFDGYRKKLSFVRLKNGDFLRLDQNEELAKLVELMQTLNVSPKDFAKGKMEIPLFRALYLDLMLEQMEDVYAERDTHFKKLVKEFKTVSDADYVIPDNLKGVMRKYQMTGYRWMRTLDEYHFGGILADDMGLGKTLQAIAVMLADHNEIELPQGEEKPVTSLVVCPASLVYNWEEELHRFAPSLSVLVVVGNAEERKLLIANAEASDVLVTSYDLLKRDIAEYEGKSFRFEFIDEAQYIKNHNTAAAKSVKLIRAGARFALTGTPIENRLSELWSIFDYLMPGFLYDYSSFRNEFEQPIVKLQDTEALERLKRMVSPFILRRSKKEVLRDLPDKLEEIRYAGFEAGGQQQKLYNAQVVRMREDLQKQTDEDFSHSRIEILAELMRIRQICCDPGLVFEAYGGDSAKREACMELIRSCIEGEHKALLFSQFTSMLALLEKDLQAEQIPYYVITGATPKERRLQMAKAFNSDDTPVFLISLKAGGTGLNLTGADVVIHYDPWWNAAVQNQATDRAHRIGQEKVVTVYQLILRNTIEERIVEMQEKKRALAEDILSAEAVGSAAISREELLALLG